MESTISQQWNVFICRREIMFFGIGIPWHSKKGIMFQCNSGHDPTHSNMLGINNFLSKLREIKFHPFILVFLMYPNINFFTYAYIKIYTFWFLIYIETLLWRRTMSSSFYAFLSHSRQSRIKDFILMHHKIWNFLWLLYYAF